MLLGAIIGDIAGSMYEGKRHGIYDDVQFFGEYCRFTDDTIMTCAVAQAIIDHKTKGVALADAAVANMIETSSSAVIHLIDRPLSYKKK